MIGKLHVINASSYVKLCELYDGRNLKSQATLVKILFHCLVSASKASMSLFLFMFFFLYASILKYTFNTEMDALEQSITMYKALYKCNLINNHVIKRMKMLHLWS